MFNRIFGNSSTNQKPAPVPPPPPPPPTGRKITVGCGAAYHFIRQIHRTGIDRGAIASFGNTFEVEQTFTTDQGALAGALMGVESKVLQKSEGTALYDSMVELGATFARASHPDAIGVVVVVTDGKDEHSKQFPNDPVTAGATYRYLMSRGRSRHLTVLIGVGSNREIDHTALTRLADHGGMQLVTVDNMGKLGDVLASIGTQLVSGVVTDVFDFGPIAAVRQRTETRLKVIPFDYVILMDRSGSMANRG